MKPTWLLASLPLASSAVGGGSSSGGSSSGGSSSHSAPQPDKDGKYWIHGDGLSAAFVAYGASIANLVVKDQYGIERDVVGGFDNASYYSVDRLHPHLGGVPGRYANRIRNSSFEMDGKRFRVRANENPTAAAPDGVDTLHGGPDGWDWRNFSVVLEIQDYIDGINNPQWGRKQIYGPGDDPYVLQARYRFSLVEKS